MVRSSFKQKIVACFIAAVMAMLQLPAPALAADTTGGGSASSDACNARFLTFPAWYKGLTSGGADCEIVSPADIGFEKFIWTIVLNVVEILLQLVGYASVAFILYGGYKYIISTGSPDNMVSARKTIMNAIIGLILSIMAVAIVTMVAGGIK